jgi:hypothetical protein
MVLTLPSVESIVMKLVVDGSEVPAPTRSSVLTLRFRSTPQGAKTNAPTSVLSTVSQSLKNGPENRWATRAVGDVPWK